MSKSFRITVPIFAFLLLTLAAVDARYRFLGSGAYAAAIHEAGDPVWIEIAAGERKGDACITRRAYTKALQENIYEISHFFIAAGDLCPRGAIGREIR